MLRISSLSGYRPIKIGSVNYACNQSNCHLSILVLIINMQYKLENAMHFLAVGLSPYQNRICQFRLQAVELTSLDFGTAQCWFT